MSGKAWQLGVMVLGAFAVPACGGEGAECFPVPSGEAVVVEKTGMETQGTGLQGGPAPDEEDQGTGLQAGPAPEEEDQGTGLQGGPASDEEEQGRKLQGPGLQGGPASEEEQQGRRMQGTGMQGGPTPGDEAQGMNLQGTMLQGGPTTSDRAYRSIGDLNGARLALASDPSTPIALGDGTLTAAGFVDTEALRGVALVGTAPDGRTFDVQIGVVTRVDRSERIELLTDGVAVCDAGAEGVFVPGRFDDTGAHLDDPGVLTYSCTNGVIAKCVDWGYAPWVTDSTVHAACTRMARADYCGSGTPWTLDGTSIEIFDTLGIRAPVTGGDFEFEAAWGADGAVCVRRTRYDVHTDADHVAQPSCFDTLPGCSSLDDAAAAGAVLANRSKPTEVDACGE